MKAARLITCPVCGGAGKINPDTLSLGARFTLERKRLDMTQAELAVQINIGRAQLANIEGDRSKPGLDVLIKAAKVFGVTTDHLLGISS